MEENKKSSQSAATESEDNFQNISPYLAEISGMDIPSGDLRNITPEPIKKRFSKVIDDK